MRKAPKPWWSIGALLALCGLLAGKFHHVQVPQPEPWVLVLLLFPASIAGLFYMMRLTDEYRDVIDGARECQAAAIVVFLLLMLL